MAAAAVVFDKATPPPELSEAWLYQRWGLGNVLELPAGRIQKINAVLNVYNACNAYQSAGGRSVEWTKRNPAAWNLVSALIADRKGLKTNGPL